MAKIVEGSRVWVRLDPKEDQWMAGVLIAKEGEERRVRIEFTGEEIVVPSHCVARWGSMRIRNLPLTNIPPSFLGPTPDINIIKRPQFEEWLGRVEEGLGISIPARHYSTQRKRLVMLTALLSRETMQAGSMGTMIKALEITVPSWKEMALIGDGLWRFYLRLVFVRRGYGNGDIHKKVAGKKLETRKRLQTVEKHLKLISLLPVMGRLDLPQGELAEAFLGWAYFFGGEKAYLRLADRYLSVLEK